MSNRLAEVHEALETCVRGAFEGRATVLRNPTQRQAPKARDPLAGTATWVVLLDDIEPEILTVLCGPVYDLKILPRVAILCVGAEADRRSAYVEATETLKAALADPTLGGVVEDARLDRPAEVDAPEHEWLAGGRFLHVRLLFNAPTPAG